MLNYATISGYISLGSGIATSVAGTLSSSTNTTVRVAGIITGAIAAVSSMALLLWHHIQTQDDTAAAADAATIAKTVQQTIGQVKATDAGAIAAKLLPLTLIVGLALVALTTQTACQPNYTATQKVIVADTATAEAVAAVVDVLTDLRAAGKLSDADWATAQKYATTAKTSLEDVHSLANASNLTAAQAAQQVANDSLVVLQTLAKK